MAALESLIRKGAGSNPVLVNVAVLNGLLMVLAGGLRVLVVQAAEVQNAHIRTREPGCCKNPHTPTTGAGERS